MEVAKSARSRSMLPWMAVLGIACVVRAVGLRGGAMWLDEIFEELFLHGSLRDLLSALVADRVHPPLEPIVAWGLRELGLGELGRRAMGALLGVVSVALLGRWATRRFGRSVGFGAALLAATSPLLLRYSQELRPYGLALLLALWTVDAADRWIVRGGESFPSEAAAAAALGALTHYFVVVIWAPVLVLAWEHRRSFQSPRRSLRRLVLAAVASLVPLAGWGALILGAAGAPKGFAPTTWTWLRVVDRGLQLFFMGHAEQIVPRGLMLLVVAPVMVGVSALFRREGGKAVLVGAVVGTAAPELVLAGTRHFSHPRYDLFGLPFLCVLIAAGWGSLPRLLRWRRPELEGAAALLGCLAVSFAAVPGVMAYARAGRPDWPAVARAVETLGGRDATVLVSNDWSRISLGFALGRFDRWPLPPEPGIVSIRTDREELLARLAAQPGCTLVLVAGYPESPGLLGGLRPRHPVADFPATDGARLYRFAGAGTSRETCWPPPAFTVQPTPGAGDLFPWLTRR